MRESCRMEYSAEICYGHYKGYTISDLSYMCAWYGILSSREIALALGRTQDAVLRRVRKLRVSGEFEFYKTLYMKHMRLKELDEI